MSAASPPAEWRDVFCRSVTSVTSVRARAMAASRFLYARPAVARWSARQKKEAAEVHREWSEICWKILEYSTLLHLLRWCFSRGRAEGLPALRNMHMRKSSETLARSCSLFARVRQPRMALVLLLKELSHGCGRLCQSGNCIIIWHEFDNLTLRLCHVSICSHHRAHRAPKKHSAASNHIKYVGSNKLSIIQPRLSLLLGWGLSFARAGSLSLRLLEQSDWIVQEMEIDGSRRK